MQKAFNWLKTHKLLTFNLAVIGYLVVPPFLSAITASVATRYSGYPEVNNFSGGGQSNLAVDSYYSSKAYPGNSYNEAAPQPDITDRKVVVDSNFSLLVKDVLSTLEQIKAKTKEISGYTVSSETNKREYGETATIQIRVPSDKVEEMSSYLRGIAVKVVSEKITGKDITDQYVDVERRLSDLEKQRTKMEEIMASAKTVNEMLEVQRGLFQIQDQIDMYKGKILYMDGTTKTSKLTVYISTDELSLPYTPDKPWRPEAVFKQAVRSLIGTLRALGSFLIWLGVYTPLALTVIAVAIIIKKKRKPVNF